MLSFCLVQWATASGRSKPSQGSGSSSSGSSSGTPNTERAAEFTNTTCPCVSATSTPSARAFSMELSVASLSRGGVGEDDGEPSASLAADTRGVDVEPLVQRLSVTLEAHVLARLHDPAEGLEPVRFGVRVELERGLARRVREARHPPERWVRLQDAIVHCLALSVVQLLDDGEAFVDRIEQLTVAFFGLAQRLLRPLALGDVPIVNRQTLLGRIGMHLVPPIAQRRASFELAGLLLAHGVVVLVVEHGAHEFGIHLPYVLS